MAVLSDYTSGTISLANGSATVTGTGTLFEVTRFREGDTLQIQNLTAVIASVDSDTQLTLTEPWTGTSIVDGPYRARQLADGTRVGTQAATLIELLGDGTLAGIAALGVEEGKALVGGPAGQYVLADMVTDPNGSLGKLAGLTLGNRQILQTDGAGNLTTLALDARQILQTDANGALKTLALSVNKFLRTDANGDLALSDLGSAAIALLNLSGTPEADRMPYLTGASGAGLAVLSAFARTILDDTSGAAVWSTLGGTAGMTESGFLRLPNGIIIQWGNNYGVGGRTIPLPQSFPNACFTKVACGWQDYNATTGLLINVSDVTNKETIIVHPKNVSNGGGVVESGPNTVTWFAVGN